MGNEYLLYSITKNNSYLTGGIVWRLRWVNIYTGDEFDTLIDSTMRNFALWQDILNDPSPWGLYSGLKFSNKKTSHRRPVATADVVPVCFDKVENQDEAREIRRHILNDERSNNTYKKLFE